MDPMKKKKLFIFIGWINSDSIIFQDDEPYPFITLDTVVPTSLMNTLYLTSF